MLDTIPLPSDTPYGNLNLKRLHVVSRLVHANRRLDESETTWQALRAPVDPASALLGQHHRFCVDEVVVHLRRAADEMIGLLWVLGERARSGAWPQRIGVDSIGSARTKMGDWRLDVLGNHEWLLSTLNEVANAHKHSFVDSDFQAIGRDEPCVIALPLKDNNLGNEASPYVVSLNSLVGDFNDFYLDMMRATQALEALRS